MADVQHATETPKHLVMSSEQPPDDQATQNKPLAVAAERPASVQGFIPSFADASKLVSAPYSCLVTVTHRRHVGLAPMYLKKKRTGIQEELNAELLRYSERLKGVPLAYDDITILAPHGDICDDNGYVHVDVSATFVVFNPTRGQKLLGVVNKLGVSHVGCLIHGCFNASIPKPNLVSVDTWQDLGPRIGAKLEFEVNQIDADQVGVVLIRGRLERTKVQELLAMADCVESIMSEDQAPAPGSTPESTPESTLESTLESIPESTPEAPDETPGKKKKKKKNKDRDPEPPDAHGEPGAVVKLERPDDEWTDARNGGDPGADGAAEPDGLPASGKKKKKKKKEKEPKDEGQEVAITATEHHCSDSSGYLSDKPSKKRKLEAAVDPALRPKDEPQTPKSKKKRKSDAPQCA